MKKTCFIFCLLTVNSLQAFEFNAPITFSPVINSGIDCEAEGVTALLSDVNYSDNDDSNKDYMAYALIDARDVILQFTDASYFNVVSPSDIELQLSLNAITARPLTLSVFDKTTVAETPGASMQAKFNHAMNNYELLSQTTFDPYDIGLDSCAAVSQLTCPDPLIFKSSTEELICDLNATSMTEFEKPLGSITVCYPPQSFQTQFGDVNVCQGSCGNGQGCEIVINTPEKVNFTENKLCSSYTYSVADVDIQNNLFGSCLAQLNGAYYVGANWNGGHTSPFTWYYLIPQYVLKWFAMDIQDNCTVDISAYHQMIESTAIQTLSDYYSNHLNSNEGQPFCELN